MNEAGYFIPELELFQREEKRKLNINDAYQEQTFLLLPPEVNNTLIFVEEWLSEVGHVDVEQLGGSGLVKYRT